MSKAEAYLSYYRKKTILITGGLGYIGSAIIRSLKDVSCSILAVDKQRGRVDDRSTSAKIRLLQADIQRKNIWKRLLQGVDIVFHLAAQTSSKAADSDPSRDVKINLLPVIHMIDVCQKSGLYPAIIFSGTATQAGFTAVYPVNEDFRDEPMTVYDINKLAAEKYLAFYKRQPKRRAVTLRLANVYGPGPASSSADRGVLNAMIKRALRGEPITVYGRGDFVRDYVYIEDVARAFLMAAEKADILKHDHYLIGSGRAATVKEAFTLARDLAFQKVGKRSKIVFVPLPRGLSRIECRNFVADSSRFRKACRWQPRVELRQGIERTIEYYRRCCRSLA